MPMAHTYGVLSRYMTGAVFEDQQEEGQNYALFIDRLQQKMDALKKLCSSRGIEQHAVDAALNGEN